MPVHSLIFAASRSLLWYLIDAHFFRNSASSACGFSPCHLQPRSIMQCTESFACYALRSPFLHCKVGCSCQQLDQPAYGACPDLDADVAHVGNHLSDLTMTQTLHKEQVLCKLPDPQPSYQVRAWRRSKSLIHASEPSVSVIRALSSGLQNASHRRGVTPLVLFWNLSGKILTKSWKMSVLMISLWMAATPLTARPPTVARKAMFTNLPSANALLLKCISRAGTASHWEIKCAERPTEIVLKAHQPSYIKSRRQGRAR